MKKSGKLSENYKIVNPDAQKLWKMIESGILIDGLYSEINRSVLDNAIHGLPEMGPDRTIWPNLEHHINAGRKIKKQYQINKNLIRIAASIVFLLSGYVLISKLRHEILQNQKYQSQNEAIESFLAQICTAHPIKCREADFIELKSEIIKLNNEKSEIENSIFFNPADSEIKKINERINNQMIDLKSQMIDYVE